jgi:hypothetical protein
MKICILLILLVGTVLGQSKANEKKTYKLEGHAGEVETKYYNDGGRVHIRININYRLTNISNQNLILWKPLINPDGIPLRLGYTFSKTSDFSATSIIEKHYGGPSNSYADEWSKLRKLLDVGQPPEELTIILKPNESWEFTSPVFIIGFKGERSDKISFETLEKVSPIWVKTYHEAWSFNIEPKAEDRSTKLVFGRMLKKRWINYGHLLLNDIVSEPIPLDLSSMVGKTESQP